MVASVYSLRFIIGKFINVSTIIKALHRVFQEHSFLATKYLSALRACVRRRVHNEAILRNLKKMLRERKRKSKEDALRITWFLNAQLTSTEAERIADRTTMNYRVSVRGN